MFRVKSQNVVKTLFSKNWESNMKNIICWTIGVILGFLLLPHAIYTMNFCFIFWSGGVMFWLIYCAFEKNPEEKKEQK